MSETGVVVVGAGRWGINHVRAFSGLGALEAVIDPDPTARERVAAASPGTRVCGSLEELGARPAGIVIATPAETHFREAMRALEHGCDVLVEKPLTLRTADAERLNETAEQHGRILMVGHLLLFQPQIQWIKAHIASGRAGKVRHVSTVRVKLGRVRRTENVWWSFAPHDLAVVFDLLDTPALDGVQAHGHAIHQTGIEDDVHVDLRFAGGVTAHLHCSWIWPTTRRVTTVIGERQSIVFDEVEGTVTVHDAFIDASLDHRDEGREVVHFDPEDLLRAECRHFIDCIATRSRPTPDGRNGIAVVDVLERAQEVLGG